jgi:hypothetical protein
MMKAVQWRQGMIEHVVPHLPGQWRARKTLIYRRPVEWLLCGLLVRLYSSSPTFLVSGIVQLLSTPLPYLHGPHLIDLGRGTPDAVHDASDPEEAFRTTLKVVRADALPAFERLGTLEGYAAAAEAMVDGAPQDPNYHEERFHLRLIQGDIAGALLAAEETERAARAAELPWADEIASRVADLADIVRQDPDQAVDVLRGHARTVRTALGLQGG